VHWWKWVIILSTVASGYWWFSIQREPAQPPSRAALEPEIARLISELEQKYSAVSEWTKDLPASPYSIEMQRALIRKDGRPILFAGRITDIRQDKEHFHLDMEALWTGASLRVILDCREETIDRILSHAPRETDYLAVAQIQSVNKAQLRVDARSEGVSSTDYDDEGRSLPKVETFTELELEAGNVFIAHGECVDVRPYPLQKR